MTFTTPKDLHRRLKSDPRADIGQQVVGDRMCLFATHADGGHSLAADFVIGEADPQIGEMYDGLINQDVGESGSDAAVSPVISVEIVHLCRVLLEWQLWPSDGCWVRESALGLTVSGSFPLVRVSAIEVERCIINPRAEIDRDLMASGWRLMNPMAAPGASSMSGAASTPAVPRIARNEQMDTMALLLIARDRWACQGVIVVTPPIAAAHGEPWRATIVNYLGDHANYMTAPTEDALYRTLIEMAP